MARIAVKPKILRWALQRSHLSIDKAERHFPKLNDWISGSKQPTLKQVESFAAMTRTPLGYFFLSKPPEEQLPFPLFRTTGKPQSGRPSPDFLETIHNMQQRQSWMREYVVQEGWPKLAFVGSAKPTDDPKEVSRDIRKVLGLRPNWATKLFYWDDALREFRYSIEGARIMVVANGVVGNNNYRKLKVREFRGFVLTDKYAPLVFVNSDDAKGAQMFTLAHEIAHIWFNKSAAFDLRELKPASDPLEEVCDKVAAEFLVPEDELTNFWGRASQEPDPFRSIALYFKVSSLVGARRALDLGLITKSEFLSFYRGYERDDRRRRGKQEGGGDFYTLQMMRVGRLFGNAVIEAARAGKLLYSEAYKLTGMHDKTLDQFAVELLKK